MKFIRNLMLIAVFVPFTLIAQIPNGYYDEADGKNGAALKTALYNIIKDHNSRSYDNLWSDFRKTDERSDGKVWDMYSNCSFTFGSRQCGNYGGVCDCYNREHSFPKSWFDDAKPMYTDLFHLYPTDGYTNGRRSNYPFGEVGNATWSGNNGTKLGSARSGLGYSGTVFEPIDEYKGDFARTYFYMVTRYENVVANWFSNSEAKPTLNGTKFPAFQNWAKEMLIRWHKEDPVSEKEIARNNAVYDIQHNRNPFIDHPEYVECIWATCSTSNVQNQVETENLAMQAWFENDILHVKGLSAGEVWHVYNVSGALIYQGVATDNTIAVNIQNLAPLQRGVYIVRQGNAAVKVVY